MEKVTQNGNREMAGEPPTKNGTAEDGGDLGGSNIGGPDYVVHDDVVRWMTEGTSPNMIPRSDCG